MKGKISLKDFIHRVKDELVEAQDRSGDPFYELTEVTLEVGFALDASATAGFDLYVVELGGATKAQQTHKVTLRLSPLPRAAIPVLTQAPDEAGAPAPAAVATAEPPAPQPPKATRGGGGGGGGGILAGLRGHQGPVYDKIRDRS